MEDGLTDKIRMVIREERESHYSEIKNAIRIYFNMGLISLIIVAFIAITVFDALDSAEWMFTQGEQLIMILLVGIATLISVIAWDIIAGINIIEQKLKILCDKKE